MVQIAYPRPVRFVMHWDYYKRWYLRWFLDFFGAVPIAPGQSKEALPMNATTRQVKQSVFDLSIEAGELHTERLGPIPLAWIRSSVRVVPSAWQTPEVAVSSRVIKHWLPPLSSPDPTDVLNIAKAVARYRITVMCVTSTFLRLFVRNRRVHPLMLESLRVVVAGAERLNSDVRDAFQAKI